MKIMVQKNVTRQMKDAQNSTDKPAHKNNGGMFSRERESSGTKTKGELMMEYYHQSIPMSEILNRIAKLQSVLLEKDMDAALILQKSDFFYFSGTIQQGWLYVPVEGRPLLMIFKDYERAKAESPIESVISLVSPKKIPEIIKDMGMPFPANLGMELDVLPTNLYFQYDNIFSYSAIIDVSTEIRLIRAVKSDYEIGQIEAAARLSDKLAEKVPEILEPGKTEIALAGELEAYARSLGHQGNVRMRLWGSELFYGHLMAGESAAVPSFMSSPTGGCGTSSATAQGAGFRKIKPNEPVLVDYVFALNGYLSDHARIFSIGPLSDDFINAHDAMLDIQKRAVESGKSGMVSGQLYEQMVSQAEDAGYGDFFMGADARKIRFTGHGLGIELDEFPFIAKGQKLVLQKGMVVALEPKVIMPGKGVVGIENTFVVTDDGLRSLGKFQNSICQI
ncbi:PepP [Desulfamplus magnetovallimortis]|uniref:PepP n=1 Tax=Desulfamplus magnetovallimortis TaxID=1246637 RepID=A0A1W1HIN4_9BACT|nr:Xaa-Pro peptidase family protein [Desulfamplus magnetovallimortis]SLM32293.1 PepP [Desulfamplus magnetovallimortis]